MYYNRDAVSTQLTISFDAMEPLSATRSPFDGFPGKLALPLARRTLTCSSAHVKAAMVFSGRRAHIPRCAMSSNTIQCVLARQ